MIVLTILNAHFRNEKKFKIDVTEINNCGGNCGNLKKLNLQTTESFK